jgi:hypothetical protein
LNAGHAADRDVIRLYLLRFVAQLDGPATGPPGRARTPVPPKPAPAKQNNPHYDGVWSR